MKKMTLEEAEITASGNAQGWVLLPRPISSLSSAKKRKDFEKVVKDARYDLFYKDWEEALTAARELSDRGGIETVQLIHVTIKPNAIFRDGKQEPKR